MKGIYWLEFGDNKLSYSIKLKRKVTIIKGDSGTGKTTMVEMLEQWLASKREGTTSGIKLATNLGNIFVLHSYDDWEHILSSMSNTLLVADEGVSYIVTEKFSGALRDSDCYLLCITRKNIKIGCLAYAIDEIYGLITVKNGKMHQTKLYNIYEDNVIDFDADVVITEDSGSGFDILKRIMRTKVVSSHGNFKIVPCVESELALNSYSNIYVIVDGAAFGSYVEALYALSHTSNKINVFAPESFEYLVLNTNMFINSCRDELEHTEEYADGKEFLTWERYYTYLLDVLMKKRFGVKYDKGSSHTYLCRVNVLKGISKQLKDLNNNLKNY